MQKYRERLASVAARGGQAERYGLLAHGKALTASHNEELYDSETGRLNARYEARLGAAMTKTLGSAALQLYAGVVSMSLPIPAENQPGLSADLEGDPFVGHARQFEDQCPAVINDGSQADGGETGAKPAQTV